jgi:hypothetical protein
MIDFAPKFKVGAVWGTTASLLLLYILSNPVRDDKLH